MRAILTPTPHTANSHRFGDKDLDIRKADPAHLRDVFEEGLEGGRFAGALTLHARRPETLHDNA